MVFRRNQNRIKHSVLILLQLISRNYKSWMRKNRTVRHYKMEPLQFLFAQQNLQPFFYCFLNFR